MNTILDMEILRNMQLQNKKLELEIEILKYKLKGVGYGKQDNKSST